MPDTEKEALCARIDELCAEIERLRLRHKGYVVDLQEALAENAKLRELVRHLRECTCHNVCAACEYADDACDFDYDMRELGLEVK